MPDLNWENPDCRGAIYDFSMRFWLYRGIDGFRIDTVNKYSKDITLPDAEVTGLDEVTQLAMKHYSYGPTDARVSYSR
jgi:oligo-1,6-glucosidase